MGEVLFTVRLAGSRSHNKSHLGDREKTPRVRSARHIHIQMKTKD